ncbi:MAG: EAL domain-containing protein [Jaaginema sp. PMC 1079.18]|nr:EAL domain-containing protein [Jaaginema sp. PMC 1080.18]MEC4852851.1 EAL domain-containing protein [Jaaginema sp. PMC 1079.18]MEC4866987.1 EAL domain-containing protein [Jaaginema sp. PMC 1078.18]
MSKGDILVVDDLPNNLRFVSTILTERGYKVRSAINGKMALTVAQAACPDLILLDIKMPEMDGYEVCECLKANPKTRDIPIIFLSALDEAVDKVKAFGVGGVDYISKPFYVEEIIARITNQLDLQTAKAEIQNLNSQLEQRVRQRTAQLEREIAQRQQAQEQLLHLALHDALTDLPNRTWFMKRLTQTLQRSRQQKNGQYAVLFLDCDRFKMVNDSLGHLAGDQLLIAVARRLESCLHPVDTLSRFGGDEFALLVEGITQVEAAIAVAQNIQQEMAAPFHIEQHQVFINASIGIVFGSEEYEQPEHLLRDADTAMYRAKALGKGNYQVFTRDMYYRAFQNLQLETDLRIALEKKELRAYYQPIISLETGKICEFETLVRWLHPQRGWISPNEFIPFAEETGLILEIDRLMLRQACHQLQEWRSLYTEMRSLRISVNFSARHFSQSENLNFIDRVLAETQLKGTDLHLEVTESTLMDNALLATQTIQELKKRHIAISIDDFGTGYSSLSYLHHLAAQVLKIDQSFIMRLNEAPENKAIVNAIVSLAHSLNMAVVAEGIETPQQMAYLRSLGCEYGQGFAISRPLDPEAATHLFLST